MCAMFFKLRNQSHSLLQSKIKNRNCISDNNFRHKRIDFIFPSLLTKLFLIRSKLLIQSVKPFLFDPFLTPTLHIVLESWSALKVLIHNVFSPFVNAASVHESYFVNSIFTIYHFLKFLFNLILFLLLHL